MTDEHDLRSRLERIASSAGDPPEHGFERVAARRHRRQRRRRGAVATAAVLAVLVAAAPLISQGLSGDDPTFTASRSAAQRRTPVEVPRLVEVHCDATGINVPVASVRPERDGLRIRVYNALPEPTVLQVVGDEWSSGDIPVPTGVHEVRQPVPPGQLTIGCDIDGSVQRRRVDLVDPAGYYAEPELDCDETEVVVLEDLPVDPAMHSLVKAARNAVGPRLVGDPDETAVTPVRGYQAQRLGDATEDPVVQMTYEGDVVAFVHVRGADGSSVAPWTVVSAAEVCASALADPPEGDATTTTTTEPPRPGSEPPE